MGFKRVLLTSDQHCGHRVGLTPPEYDLGPDDRWRKVRRQLWDEYRSAVNSIKPINIHINLGDSVDGKGTRSGGTELLTSDRSVQIQMAAQCITESEAETYRLIHGTPYHVGTNEDWEQLLADRMGWEIGSHDWFDINGTILDCKHKIGSTSIPHGKGTAIAKDRLWNVLWSEHEEQPKSDILIRGHVHFFHFTGDDDWLGIYLPALQGQGSKFGARICSGLVHFGIVWVDCYDDGSYIWGRKIVRVSSQKREAEIL